MPPDNLRKEIVIQYVLQMFRFEQRSLSCFHRCGDLIKRKGLQILVIEQERLIDDGVKTSRIVEAILLISSNNANFQICQRGIQVIEAIFFLDVIKLVMAESFFVLRILWPIVYSLLPKCLFSHQSLFFFSYSLSHQFSVVDLRGFELFKENPRHNFDYFFVSSVSIDVFLWMNFKIIGGGIPQVKFPLISKNIVRLQLVPAPIRILFIFVKKIVVIWILQVIEQVIGLLIASKQHAGGVIDPSDLHLNRPKHVVNHTCREIVHTVEDKVVFYWLNVGRRILRFWSFVEEISVYAGAEVHSEKLDYLQSSGTDSFSLIDEIHRTKSHCLVSKLNCSQPKDRKEKLVFLVFYCYS